MAGVQTCSLPILPDPPPCGAVSVESRSNPTVNQVAMPRKTTLLFTFYSCGRQERIKRPDLFGKVIEKQTFAQPECRNDQLGTSQLPNHQGQTLRCVPQGRNQPGRKGREGFQFHLSCSRKPTNQHHPG